MKKFILVVLSIILILCTSISFAKDNHTDENYINEEIFKYILFDYNFLTENSLAESQEIFNEIGNTELTKEEIKFINNVGINQESSESIVLFIQENYDELMEEKNKAEKNNR